MDELKREVIFAVSQMKEFERFLKSDLKYCVLMDIHLALLASMVKAAHEQEKKVFFHLDYAACFYPFNTRSLCRYKTAGRRHGRTHHLCEFFFRRFCR